MMTNEKIPLRVLGGKELADEMRRYSEAIDVNDYFGGYLKKLKIIREAKNKLKEPDINLRTRARYESMVRDNTPSEEEMRDLEAYESAWETAKVAWGKETGIIPTTNYTLAPKKVAVAAEPEKKKVVGNYTSE